MNPSSDIHPTPPSPERLAEFLRQRVQEAISASVHHASLSQQYLSLSQRFSALAEQASSGNALLAYQSVHQLEREANTGIPAATAQPLSACLETVDSADGRKRVSEYLDSQPFPHYEQSLDEPGLLVRIEADGKRTVGRFVNREFQIRKSPKKKRGT